MARNAAASEDVIEDLVTVDSKADNQEAEFLDDEEMELAPNQFVVTVGYSHLNEIRYMASTEGIDLELLLSELVAESVERRLRESNRGGQPNHLITRTGYVSNDASGYQAPRLSHHHNMQGQRNGQGQGQGDGRKPGAPKSGPRNKFNNNRRNNRNKNQDRG